MLLVRAPNVTALKLEEVDPRGLSQEIPAADTLSDGGRQWHIDQSVDISKAGGMTHARRTLMTDTAYDWSAVASSAPDWEYALVFRDEQSKATVLISVSDATIGLLESDRRVSFAPSAEAMREFLVDQFGDKDSR